MIDKTVRVLLTWDELERIKRGHRVIKGSDTSKVIIRMVDADWEEESEEE